MKKRTLLAGIIFASACLAAESGMELYQKAVTQERAGKMEEAIRLYEKVAHDFASDRALAAKALVAAARDYEKLGQDKAVKIYEQVARDFGDQREFAATANARLAALRQSAPAPATQRQTKIEIAGAVDQDFGSVYSDGQRAVYQDEASNALVIGDLAGKNKRVVYKLKPGESFNTFLGFKPSRDLSMVYLRLSAPGGKVTHAVIKIDGTGYRELFQGYPYGAIGTAWSWDNRYLLFFGVPPGPPGAPRFADDRSIVVGGGLEVVSVSDGKGREVLRRDASIFMGAFSPDGRFIAFSEGLPRNMKTFVLPVQGGEPQLISGDANLADWTRDGRYLAVSSTRSDLAALWLLPVKDGRPSGDPVFVRNAGFLAGDILPNEALLYRSIGTGSKRAALATLDSNGHLGTWKTLDLKIGGNDGVGAISWSPDSTQIAYPSAHADAGQLGTSFRVRNIVSGEDRELHRDGYCYWEANHPSLFCLEGTAPAREAVSVALDSGRAERLGPISPPSSDPSSYFGTLERFAREKGIEIINRESINLGPDPSARLVNHRDLEIRSTPGSDWRHLVSLNADQPILTAANSLDGKWMFYVDKDSAGKDSLFRVSPAGGQPERLGELPAQYRSPVRMIHISPDGRNILLEGLTGSPDTWLLENFEPKAPAAR